MSPLILHRPESYNMENAVDFASTSNEATGGGERKF